MDGLCAFSATARNKQRTNRRPAWQWSRRLLLLLLLLAQAGSGRAATQLQSRPATIVDVNVETGSVRVSGPDRDFASSPGSTLKPFVLFTALKLGVLTPGTRIVCRGTLHLRGRNLTCSHPASLGVLDAEEALAYSCNTYFGQIAQQLSPAALHTGLEEFRFHPDFAVTTPEARMLLVLGLQNVSTTPLQLAQSYVELARALQQGGSSAETVRLGLLGSVTYGMAHAAQSAGLALGGKTGTAHGPAPMLQHGWFAGIVFSSRSDTRATHVLVVYAPSGSGNDAALAAHNYLRGRHW